MNGVTYSQASQIAACLAMLGSVGVGCGLLMRHPPQSAPMAGSVGPRVEQHVSTTNAPESPDVTALPDETVAASEER